ncbi:MAG: polysaccharide deacetylase family protein [Actinomycetota bacterium]|nr:polysaccharide deacetylase family protein [Actinomycetota bacterium]
MLGSVLPALAPVLPGAARAVRIPLRLEGTSGVGLTFDDGPHPEGTPAVLEILARAGAQATFFLVGEQVLQRPSLAAEIAAAGHVVAVHCHRHRLQLLLTRSQLEADLRRAVRAIEDATGVTPRWHRPPYGVYSLAGLETARAAGLAPLLWSRWGKDWRRFTTPARIASRATRELSAGDVILLHDADFYSSRNSHQRTVEALTAIMKDLSRRDLATVLPV